MIYQYLWVLFVAASHQTRLDTRSKARRPIKVGIKPVLPKQNRPNPDIRDLHPVSSHSCCMYVRAGRPAFARPYVGVHRSTSVISSSLLLQQCPACLARVTCIVFVIGGKWPYSWCLVVCYRQDLFIIALNILV